MINGEWVLPKVAVAFALLLASYRFAAALAVTHRPMWVLNVVPVSGWDTLPLVYERGLIGVYHDWCESLSTYPRSYDLLHMDHLLDLEAPRCRAASSHPTFSGPQ